MAVFRRAPIEPCDLDLRVQLRITEACVNNINLVHHGGCVSCVFSMNRVNQTLSGMRYCSGCMYMNPDWTLKDKGVHAALAPGVHTRASIEGAISGKD